MLLVDKYSYTNKLRDQDPRAKFFLAFLGLIVLRIIDSQALYLINILLMAYLSIFRAGVAARDYKDLFSIPLVFLLLSIFTIMISIDNKDYLLSIKIFSRELGITGESLREGGGLFISVISSLSSIYFFVLTTPMNQIIGLLKKFRLNDLFIELMILIYRSIFIFLEEMANMNMAQEMKFGYEKRSNWIRSISLLIANLFRKIFEKHKNMIIALECKLYDGEFKIGD